MSEPAFAIYAVPIDRYSSDGAKPFASIAADDDVKTIADLLVPLGGGLHEWSAKAERDGAWVREQLARWADRDRPGSSVLVWVGHGESDGNDAWLASYETRRNRQGTGHNPDELANHLYDEWARRRQDKQAWTLVVIEACGAERFVELMLSRLASKPNAPDRFALLAGGGRGSSFLAKVPAALQAVLESYDDNDEVIRIHDLVNRLEDRLDPGRAFLTGLSRARPLTRPRLFPQGITAPHDVYAELKEYLSGLPADQRAFFVPKAQGTELGELTWYFEGRGRERHEIADWLRENDSGLLAVTGAAGSGKSAVLGNLVVHTSPALRDLLIRTGQVDRLAAPEQPPDNVFDASVLLTGLTTGDVMHRLATDLGGNVATMEGLRSAVEGRTMMVDALDEAQDPLGTAAVLRQLSEVPGCRIVVGTRRSTTEGPDLPEPDDTNLLDTLGEIEKVTVDLDTEAVTKYVEHRLSALAIDPETAAAAARNIGAHNRHFLYARLAVHEILARPELLTAAAQGELTALLAQDHRGLFAAAVRRLTVADSNFRPLLEALAHARGRGLPRADGVWAVAATAFGNRRPSEADLDNLLLAAAPYIMLDGEHGQSTYRLAHQTFVEHFHAEPTYAAGHRRVAEALARQAADGWADANFYPVRYLAEHLVADSDRMPPASDGVVELVTDPGWLARAVELLGVDQTAGVIAAARAVIEQDASRNDVDSTIRWVTTFQPIDVVERTLRRSRIALSRDPAQLAGQLHARLKQYPTATITALGDALGKLTSTPWLRMVEGSLDWRADLESVYGTSGKVRGLGFGQIDDRPVVAIAIDTRVELWDPRTGVPDVAATVELGRRPTAVAMSVIDGRPVVVTTAGYDGILEVWDARSRERLAATHVGLGHALGIGRIDDRLVIAGVPLERSLKLLDALTLQPLEVPPALAALDVRGFGVDDGALLLLAVQDEPEHVGAHRILVVDPADGREIWRTDPVESDSGSLMDVMTAARIGSPFVVVAGIENRLFWFTEGNAKLQVSPYSAQTRAIAVGLVGGRAIVALSPDYDGTALVQLQQIEYDASGRGVTLSRPGGVEAPLTRSERFAATPVPEGLGDPARLGPGQHSFLPFQPETWPATVATAGEVDGVPVIATGSVEGAVWIWDERAIGPGRSHDHRPPIAGPFAWLPPHVLELGWGLLHAKPGLERVTSVALGNLPGHGAVVAVACGGQARLYAIADQRRIENPADDAAAVKCVAIGSLNGRSVLVTGSTGGNVTVWDPVAGTRVAGLALDDPIANLAVESDRIFLRTTTFGDYALELKEP